MNNAQAKVDTQKPNLTLIHGQNEKPNSAGFAIWSVCHNTGKDLWKTYIVDFNTMEIQKESKVTVGRDRSYESLLYVLRGY